MGAGGPTDDKIPANLSNGEYVIRASRVKQLGVPFFDHLNDPRGGIGDWFRDRYEDVSGIAGEVRGLVRKGAGIALGWLYDKTLKPAIGYLKGQGFIQDFIYNIFESFGKKMKEWGGKEDEEAEKEKAKQQAAKGSYTYNGPASGWRYPLTSKYYGGNWGGHSPSGAFDISAPYGAAVVAVANGIARRAFAPGRSYGNYVIISHGGGIESLYAHLSGITKSGQVKIGDVIGRVGTSGQVPAHLHFEIRNVASTGNWMKARGVDMGPIYPHRFLAKGGVARATPGGILATIAEAGRDERVEPLDRDGLSVRDKALIKSMAEAYGANGGGGPTVVRVYIGDRELTDIVKYEVVTREKGLARDLAFGRRRSR